MEEGDKEGVRNPAVAGLLKLPFLRAPGDAGGERGRMRVIDIVLITTM